MEVIDRIKAGVTAFKNAFVAPCYSMGKPKSLDKLLERLEIASALEELSKKKAENSKKKKRSGNSKKKNG